MNRASNYPEPACTCTAGKVDELCPKHGVFAERWSGIYSVQIETPAEQQERRERARRRRLKRAGQ